MFEAKHTPPEKGRSVFFVGVNKPFEYDIRCAYHPAREHGEFLRDGTPVCRLCWYILVKA
jgi:hypothetical protein